MTDRVTKEKRSEIMSKIHSKDTQPELKVRRYLYHIGYRYRKNYKALPGSPDIYLHKYNTAIFINGCFWHAHDRCKYFTYPKSNVEYWSEKLSRNKKRDFEKTEKLINLGIEVIILWECDIIHNFEFTMQELEKRLTENQFKSKRGK